MLTDDITRAIDRFVHELTIQPVDLSINSILENAMMAEHEIRLFLSAGCQDVAERYIGLIDIFNLHRLALRIRKVDYETAKECYIPLSVQLQRPDLDFATVFDIETFRHQWDLFTHGVLRKMRSQDWENVLAAGGSVLACILPPQVGSTDRKLNEYFQSEAYSSSFVDLFLWGLTQEQAEQKMEDIFKAVCAAAPWAVTCVRRAGVISIHTTYPFRPIQIILHLYQSPAEILAGIDVDSSCVAYDGKRVYANPRALAAMVRRANTIDVTRCSPSYEYKLAKYARRGFQIFVPSLKRERVKPWVYDPDLRCFPHGLAKLLVLERALTSPYYYTYLRFPTTLTLAGSNSVSSLRKVQMPYGPTWDAKAIRKTVNEKAAWINSPSNSWNVAHAHIFFVGSMRKCLKSSCKECEQNQGIDLSGPERRTEDLNGYIKVSVSFTRASPDRSWLESARPIEFYAWAKEAFEDRDPEEAPNDDHSGIGASDNADTDSYLEHADTMSPSSAHSQLD